MIILYKIVYYTQTDIITKIEVQNTEHNHYLIPPPLDNYCCLAFGVITRGIHTVRISSDFHLYLWNIYNILVIRSPDTRIFIPINEQRHFGRRNTDNTDIF